MNNDKKWNYFGLCLAPVGIVFVVQQILSIMGMEFLVCLKACTFKTGDYMDYMQSVMDAMLSANFNVAISILYALICIVAFSMWYAKAFIPKREGKRVSIMKSMTQYHLVLYAGLVLLAAGAQIVCTFLINVVSVQFPQWLAFYEQLVEGMGMTDEHLSVGIILYTVILGPICEELTFRGLTFGYARKYASFWVANIIQSILFAALHMNMLQASYTFFVGLLLGYLMYKSENILVPMMFHILFNFAGLFFAEQLNIGTTAISFFLILLASLMACYGGVLLVNMGIAKRKQQEG